MVWCVWKMRENVAWHLLLAAASSRSVALRPLLYGAVAAVGPCLLFTTSISKIGSLYSLISMCFCGILISWWRFYVVSGKVYDRNVATKVAVLFNMKYFDVFIIFIIFMCFKFTTYYIMLLHVEWIFVYNFWISKFVYLDFWIKKRCKLKCGGNQHCTSSHASKIYLRVWNRF